MYFHLVAIFATALFYQASAYGNVNSGYGGTQNMGYGGMQQNQPTPYQTEYQIDDGNGNMQYRKEQGDGNGNVKGSYGYSKADGVYRDVEYQGDKNGIKEIVNSNEPGLDPYSKVSPADVQMNVRPAPPGVQPEGPQGTPRMYGGPSPKMFGRYPQQRQMGGY